MAVRTIWWSDLRPTLNKKRNAFGLTNSNFIQILMSKILTIIAHPDDETMLSGGTLALLARAGAEVHYLCATRGEGGEVGVYIEKHGNE